MDKLDCKPENALVWDATNATVNSTLGQPAAVDPTVEVVPIDQTSVAGSMRATPQFLGEKVNDNLVVPPLDNESTFANLQSDENRILNAQLDSPSTSVNFFMLYRYADTWDCLIIVISVICSIAAGAVLPLLSVG